MSGIWAPCLRMSRHKIFPPVKIVSASGGWLYTEEGHKIFDATSSWWCKHLGHRHPKIMAAISRQSEQYIHAIGANTYSESIEALSKKLTNIYPDLNRVSYASDGSSAVEIAIKMALHTRKIMRPEDKRTGILKLEGAYHGETILAMSVSDCEMYKLNYKEILINTLTCPVLGACNGIIDHLWHDADATWSETERQLEQISDKVGILIVEPLLQAANCMRIYSADWLEKLMLWCKRNNIDIIFDEIMTGFWRTGRYMAADYMTTRPDFICLGKGLSAGSIPISAVLAKDDRFLACYPERGAEQPFLHSHTYSAHALAAATADAALSVYQELDITELALNLSSCLEHELLSNTRSLGCVVAAEVTLDELGAADIQKVAAENGLLIRPLGNTIYICPPLNTTSEEIEHIKQALFKTLESLC